MQYYHTMDWTHAFFLKLGFTFFQPRNCPHLQPTQSCSAPPYFPKIWSKGQTQFMKRRHALLLNWIVNKFKVRCLSLTNKNNEQTNVGHNNTLQDPLNPQWDSVCVWCFWMTRCLVSITGVQIHLGRKWCCKTLHKRSVNARTFEHTPTTTHKHTLWVSDFWWPVLSSPAGTRGRLLNAFGRLAQIMSHMVCSDEQPCTKLASENKPQLFHFRAGLYYTEVICLFSQIRTKMPFNLFIYSAHAHLQSGL